MGICGEDKIKKEEEKDKQNVPIQITDRLMKSICKIILEKDKKTATGFFMTVSDSFKYIITNYINLSQYINDNIIIEIWNTKKIKLNLNNHNIIYLEKPKDITAIKLEDSDKMPNEIYFIDNDINSKEKGYLIYKDIDVYALENPFKRGTSCIKGKILNINDYEFEHNIPIMNNLSGCPILIMDKNNKNFMYVIGIQKNGDEPKKFNLGTFIGEIFKEKDNKTIKDSKNELNTKISKEETNIELNKNITNEQNYITAEISINEEDVNKDIRIINSYEEYMRKNYPTEELNISEKNESEIKQCEIKINDEPILFDYFYKFNKKGNYKIQYSFKDFLTKINFMFGECASITNINFSNFNTKNVINMSWIFGKCFSLNIINLDINTENVIDMSGMFYECKSLENIDLSKLNTPKVKNMQMMFKKCTSIKNLNLSSLNTQNVISMSGMFEGCKNIEEINLSSFNTQNVTDMSGMFDSCKALTKIDILNFNTQKVINMSCMFCECNSLKNLSLSNFKTDNLVNIYCMFFNCKSLKNLDLSNFNTKNVTDMGSVFYGCESLTNLDLSNFNTQKVIDMSEMFYDCRQLSNLDLTNFNTSSVKNMNYMFNGCNNLSKENIKVKDNNIIKEF